MVTDGRSEGRTDGRGGHSTQISERRVYHNTQHFLSGGYKNDLKDRYAPEIN